MSVSVYWYVLDMDAPPPEQTKWWVGIPSEDPRVVLERWVGGRGTLQVVEDLALPYDLVEEWWEEAPRAVTVDQMCQIAKAGYVDGPSPDEVQEAEAKYPPGRYRWLVLVWW